MGGPSKVFKKLIDKGVEQKVIKKAEEQPKVKSQMDNTDVKSDLINADKLSLENKRKGRRSTVLTSVTGVDGYPTLNKKTLLG
tara:strand:- start:540 stop:788 length:249 start_codon:yes stop_codon:yes gene_type:complete